MYIIKRTPIYPQNNDQFASLNKNNLAEVPNNKRILAAALT